MSPEFVKLTVTTPGLPQPPAADLYGRSWQTEHGPVRTVLAVLQPGWLCHRVYARPTTDQGAIEGPDRLDRFPQAQGSGWRWRLRREGHVPTTYPSAGDES